MMSCIYSGRHDSEDDVQLDLSKDTAENAREILLNICKKHGLTEGKRFAYLNAFVKLVSKSNVGTGDLGYSVEEIQCCLRVALVHEASQVRAAVLRAVRYLLKEEKDVKTLNRLRYSFLIARCLDVNLRNDMERVQALRLVRRMLILAPADFPPTLVRSLVALANGAAEEKDRMLRACLAALSEICVLNSEVFIVCGGVSAILRNILDCQMPRIAESLCGVLLFLLNSPTTRAKACVRLQVLAAPYCDFHWDNSKNRDEREVRFHCSRLALLSVLRSWPGVLHFCHPGNSSGLRSIVDILYVKQLEVRKAVLDLLYDLLGLPQPEWTDEYGVALEAVDPSHPRDTWKLSEGFVAAEGRAVLPHLSKYRPNLVEIHLSMLLYTFLEVGLLEAIVEVIVSSDTFISVRATILLGELLHLVHTLLPPECCNLTPALPNLLAHASDTSAPITQHQALAAVATLSHLHQMLKRRPAPASLFLDQLLQAGGWGRTGTEDIGPGSGKVKREKSKLYQLMLKDVDDTLKESAVLTTKDGFSWNWNVVRAVLKSRSEALKKLEDSNHRTFVRRLVHYFKPSSNRFSRVELGNKRQTHMYTMAGCELIDCLLDADEPEGGKLLSELLADIWVQIDAITSSKSAHDCLFSPQHVSNSLCQDYFLFVGRLCRTTRGVRVLDKAGILQQLLNLVVSTNHECYVKLVVSSLDYSIDGMPRVILSKVLTAPSEASRLYATQFLLVLLRARLPDFAKWGVELLVMQLYDQSRAVSLAAIAILTEAAEEKVYLDAVVALRPSLLHLGDKGLLLLVRFLATPTGFTFLHDANFVTNQLEKWATSYNYRYVRLVEGELHDSLTLHQRGEDGRYSRRVTSAKSYVRDVYVPPHLYGQLVQHDRGLQLLLRDTKLPALFQCVHGQRCSSEQEVLELKAALWGCGHIATSPAGVGLLSEEGVITATVRLAETCPVYSVRGTAFYVLGLMATTFQGANELSKAGWLCVRHHRHERWPVIEVEPEAGDLAHSSCQEPDPDNLSMSSGAAAWDLEPGGLSGVRGAHAQRSFYIADEDESLASGEDEGMMLDESTCSARWTDLTSGSGAVHIPPSQQRKSQTLPHWRSPRGALLPHRHIRSLSESKQPQAERESIGDWAGDASSLSRGREPCLTSQPSTGVVVIAPKSEEGKSRSNSCTDSSGVSSCDSGLGKHTTSERIQTLSPIPSSTSLNTLKSAAILNRRSSQTSGRKHSTQGSVTSEGAPSSPDTSCSRLSHQDLVGYATLRSLHRHRRPLYSDTTSLAAEELLGFDDHGVSTSAALARAMRARSLDRQYSHPVLCEFEATMPPQLLSGSSSVSLAARTYYGSRSNIGRQQGPTKEGELSQQCYMGICLPRQLAALFPQDEQGTQRPGQSETTRCRGSASFSEMEQVQEAVEDAEGTSSTNSDDPDSPVKARSSFTADTYRHSAATCLSCCRMRDRKVSTSSYHRHRTDTESSYGGGESPVLYQRRRKSQSTSSCLLVATPGGSVESANSLEVGSTQRTEEASAAPSRALVRKEILKHVGRMSNPVWSKLSKQALLQLKQKYASIFQDVCLYSAVCHRMGSSTYRLVARRFIQELFLDLSFDVLYDDPAVILQMQQPPPSSSMERVGSSMSPPTGLLYTSQSSTSPKPPVSPAQSMGSANALLLSALTASTLPARTVPMGTNTSFSNLVSEKNLTSPCSSSNGEKVSVSGQKSSGGPEQDTEYMSARPTASDPVPIVTTKATAVPGGFVVRSPPLEVVTEESGLSISSSERLSPMEGESSVSNCQVDEENIAFLNLRFDDIPMIDEAVRIANTMPERTRESVSKPENPQKPRSQPSNVQVKSEALAITATQLEHSYEHAEVNLSKAAIASKVIKRIPLINSEVGNSDILVKNNSRQESIHQRGTHDSELPKVTLSLQNPQIGSQPMVTASHERSQSNYKSTANAHAHVSASGRELQTTAKNIKPGEPSVKVSQTVKNSPSTDKSSICHVPYRIKTSVHEVDPISIDSQASTYQHTPTMTASGTTTAAASSGVDGNKSSTTALQQCFPSSASTSSINMRSMSKTSASPLYLEPITGTISSAAIPEKLEIASIVLSVGALTETKQPVINIAPLVSTSAETFTRPMATNAVPLISGVAISAAQEAINKTLSLGSCSVKTTKQTIANKVTADSSSPVTLPTRASVSKNPPIGSGAVDAMEQATIPSVSSIQVYTSVVTPSAAPSINSSTAKSTQVAVVSTELPHSIEAAAGTAPSGGTGEATANVPEAPTLVVMSRQRKMATAAPPNISSFSEVPLSNKNVPTSDKTKQNR